MDATIHTIQALLVCLNVSTVGAINGAYLQRQVLRNCTTAQAPKPKPGTIHVALVCKCGVQK